MDDKEKARIYNEHRKDKSLNRGAKYEALEIILGIAGLFVVLPWCAKVTGSIILGFLLFFAIEFVVLILLDKYKKKLEEEDAAEQRANDELWSAIYDDDKKR